MRIILSILVVFLILGNCQQNKTIQTNVSQVDSVKLNKLITENKGKVLVINVWATWCIPCVEEMPDLVKLTDSYASQNVQVIGISIDFPEEIQSKILPFIKNNNINFPVYVNNFKKDEDLINFLSQEWSGAVPATFIYDKHGVQKEFLLGKHSFEEFKKVVDEYL